MKKSIIFILVFFLGFVSCNKANFNPITSFQIINNLKLYPPVEFIDGSLWEVQVYYYNGNTLIKTDSIPPILTGTISIKIEVSENVEKMKFSFQIAPKKSQYYNGVANCRMYSKDFIFFEKGRNTIIEIHDLSSMILSL